MMELIDRSHPEINNKVSSDRPVMYVTGKCNFFLNLAAVEDFSFQDGKYITFLVIDEKLFFYAGDVPGGFRLFAYRAANSHALKNESSDVLKMVSSSLFVALQKRVGIKNNFKYPIKKTDCDHQGNILFSIELPKGSYKIPK